MIIVMKVESTKKDINHILENIEKAGLKGVLLQGTNRNVIAVIGDERIVPADFWDVMPGVEKTVPILAPYKLASKEGKDFKTIIHLSNGKKIGGDHIAVIAGPCAIESKEQIVEIAKRVRDAGATALRGGAFKPRSNPYTFQGLQEEGLVHLARARETSGLPIVTEVLTPEHVKLVSKYSDILQVGTRNMQNFLLLRAVGEAGKPVILKRGMSATIEEFLLAAEYILAQNNPNVILCERGIRTFETHTRFTLSLSVVPQLKEMTHLPIIVDPSHGTGKRSLVNPMSKGSIAVGVDGRSKKAPPKPDKPDRWRQHKITRKAFEELMQELKPVAEAVGRKI